MKIFAHFVGKLGIRQKILATNLLACTLALLLAGAAFMAIETTTVKRALHNDLATQAEVIAKNCSAALTFNDPAAAKETLRSLQAKPNIIKAYILNPGNQILAEYHNDNGAGTTLRLPGEWNLTETATGGGRLDEDALARLLDENASVRQQVAVDGETIGSVVLVSDLSPLYQRLSSYAINALLIMVLAGVVAYLFSTRLAERIANPIHDLASTMTKVASEENYALRAKTFGTDEVGTLVDQFNTMLGRIEERDVMLQQRGEVLQQLAHYDALTGLPNRLLVVDRLGQAIAHAAANDEKVAVIFIDLDHFKDINDSLGHRVGDLLLKEVGARLKESIRGSDNVGRLGGDEFVIFLTENKPIENVVIMVQRLVNGFAVPFNLEGKEVFMTASIGVTFFPLDGEKVEDLLKNADTAMYSVKAEGKNHYQFFSPEMQLRANQRLDLHNGLRHALERQEFFLAYQPVIDLASHTVCGVEALLRWQCPSRGVVPPMEFIPLAEETGLIVPIGEWVIREVCRQIRSWQSQGLNPPRVAVNISAVQFKKQNLAEIIVGILAETGTDPALLGLELTESFLISSSEAALEALWALRRHGVRISIDDFGTGYSSLSYLRRIPIDAIKIDRSFVANSLGNKEDAVIIKAILSIGRNLALRVVGEGVESDEQLAFLTSQGCHEAQGYLFSRPISPDACASLMAATPSFSPGTRTN